jgi:hypothetical protein
MSVIVSVFSIVGLFARAGTVPTGWMGTIAVVVRTTESFV